MLSHSEVSQRSLGTRQGFQFAHEIFGIQRDSELEFLPWGALRAAHSAQPLGLRTMSAALGTTLIFILGIVGLWLGAALLIYGAFVHSQFGIADDLRNFPKPGLAAAALLGPGAAMGAHFVLPMPPGAAILFSAFTLNIPSVLLNALVILLVAGAFFSRELVAEPACRPSAEGPLLK